MKSQLRLKWILGSAVFLTQLTQGTYIAAEAARTLSTSEEVIECANDLAENIRETALEVLAINPNEQTFDNTLRPWSRLAIRLAENFRQLDVHDNSNPPIAKTASYAFDTLQAYFLEVIHSPELYQTLETCFLKTTFGEEPNPFQHYIGARLMGKGFHEPVYLHGSAEEQNNSSKAFTILNIKSDTHIGSEISDFTNNILLENADVICIQEIIADDHAYDLYQALKESYAHFVYVPPTAMLDILKNQHESGMLIASKYFIEKPEFNIFLENQNDTNDGFLDFVITSSDATLGHVYAANLRKNVSDQETTDKFMQIIEKIQDNVLTDEKESIQFVLYNDSCNLKNTMVKSIDNQNEHHVVSIISRPTITCSSTFIPRQLVVSKRRKTLIKGEFKILPVRSHRDRDNDRAGGSWEVGGGIKYGGREGPQFDAYAQAEAHDGKGNYVEGRADHNFNSGEGTVGVRGGNKDDKD